MLPLNLLPNKLRILSEDRFPTEGERTPVSPWDGKFSATTRRCLPLHLTPSQLQYPSSVLLFQEASASLLPLTAAALKASSAASSSASVAGSVEKNMEAASSNSKHAQRIAMLVALGNLWAAIGVQLNMCVSACRLLLLFIEEVDHVTMFRVFVTPPIQSVRYTSFH